MSRVEVWFEGETMASEGPAAPVPVGDLDVFRVVFGLVVEEPGCEYSEEPDDIDECDVGWRASCGGRSEKPAGSG